MDKTFNRFQPIAQKHNNNIPILGQPIKVFECVPITTFQCNCKPDNLPIIIPGVDVFKRCEACKKIYGITAVSYDRRNMNQTIVTISVINIRQPEAPNELIEEMVREEIETEIGEKE